MRTYIIRRLLLMVPVLWGATAIVFIMMRLLPGDAITAKLEDNRYVTKEQIARLRADLDLDKPAYVQYGKWVFGLMRGDLGKSLHDEEALTTKLKQAFPVTAQLSVMALVLGLMLAIPLGILAALKQDGPVDYVARFISVLGLSVPNFFLATLVILAGAIYFHWVPPFGYIPMLERPMDSLKQLLIPSVILGTSLSAITFRLVRSSVLEVLREDFIRTARAKGLTNRVVILRHTLKNALIPVVTVVGLQFGSLLGGTLIIEGIFSIPGMGLLMLSAIHDRDYTIVQGLVLIAALVFTVANLVVDVMYGWLDPRIKYG